MGRRSGFTGLVNAMAREAARQARLAEAERKRSEREALRSAREAQRALIQIEREAKIRYLESREEETDDLNVDLTERVADAISYSSFGEIY